MNLTFYWISIMFKVNRKYFFRKWRKVDTFFHNISSTVLKSLYNDIDDFLIETRHLIKNLCKQKVQTLFLSTLITLIPTWVPLSYIYLPFKYNLGCKLFKISSPEIFLIFLIGYNWSHSVHFHFVIQLLQVLFWFDAKK